MKKKCLPLLLALCLLLAAGGGEAWAASEEAQEAAQYLYDLGLFRGTEQGFELDAPCSRVQGAVIFTRLLGAEEEAEAKPKPHPFVDITEQAAWAAPQIGYLYLNGLARGVSYNQFGIGAMDADQFSTFCLRALGYREGKTYDFVWDGALNAMVEHGILSGSLRNRLLAETVFTRGDAVLLARATLAAPLNGSEQTLLAKLVSEGVVEAEVLLDADLRIAYPADMFTAERLQELAGPLGYEVAAHPYELRSESQEALYNSIRDSEGRGIDLAIVPLELGERLYGGALLVDLNMARLPKRNLQIEPLRNNPYWYGRQLEAEQGMPVAFELLCIFYDSKQYRNPNWAELFKAENTDKICLPADPARAVAAAFQYSRVSFATQNTQEIAQVTTALAQQWPLVDTFTDQMLELPKRRNAGLGLLSSRDLPALAALQQSDAAYANWQAILPEGGSPITLYYAVIPIGADQAKAYEMLEALTTPQTQAETAHLSGYLPTVAEAEAELKGLAKEVFPKTVGRWQKCRFMDLTEERVTFFEQTQRNALCEAAANAKLPELSSLEVYYEQNGLIRSAHRLDFTNLLYSQFQPETPQATARFTEGQSLHKDSVKSFQQAVKTYGMPLWKSQSAGPEDWRVVMNFADGTNKTCRGGSQPLTWYEMAVAASELAGAEVFKLNW